MKSDKVFIGDIKKCTKYESHVSLRSETYFGDECIGCESFGYIEREGELHKENAVLVMLDNGGYVDIDRVNGLLDYISIYRDSFKDGFRIRDKGLIMSTSPSFLGNLYVDSDSLTPYYGENNEMGSKDVSIRSLRKEIRNK